MDAPCLRPAITFSPSRAGPSSSFASMPPEILELICSFFPFGPRMRLVSSLSKQFRRAVLRSVTEFPRPILLTDLSPIVAMFPCLTSISFKKLDDLPSTTILLPRSLQHLILPSEEEEYMEHGPAILEALTPQHSLTELSLVIPKNWRTPLLLPSTLRKLSLDSEWDIAALLATADLPRLESLTLRIMSPLFPPFITSIASQLTHLAILYLYHTVILPVMPLSNLRSLHVHAPRAQAENLAWVVPLASQLTHLYIGIRSSGGIDVIPPELFPYITSLTIPFPTAQPHGGILFQLHSLRRLQNLRLGQSAGPLPSTLWLGPCEALDAAIARLTEVAFASREDFCAVMTRYQSWPRLKTLWINGWTEVHQDAAVWDIHLPALEHLQVYASVGHSGANLLPLLKSTPKLRKVTIQLAAPTPVMDDDIHQFFSVYIDPPLHEVILRLEAAGVPTLHVEFILLPKFPGAVLKERMQKLWLDVQLMWFPYC